MKQGSFHVRVPLAHRENLMIVEGAHDLYCKDKETGQVIERCNSGVSLMLALKRNHKVGDRRICHLYLNRSKDYRV